MKAAALFLALFAMLTLSAATLRFRGGDVLSAELSRQAPEIRNGEKIAALQNTTGKYFARVAVKLAPGRKLSTEDFSLYCFGTSYRCLAVGENGTSFDAAQWLIAPAEGAVCYLIFVIDGTLIGDNGPTRIEIKCNAPGDYPSTTLPFVNLGDSAFGASAPAGGAF